ncbi:MAG TPA: methyltransferase domain-containing protein [Methylomirabilota bacterium]|nr:methyltransferase domain-containing protein [Methylomirabilota bacterium]
MRVRYDGSGIDQVYEAAWELSPDSRAVWATVLSEQIGRRPITRVLEVGCGTGRFARLLLELFPATVCGIDPSGDMLRASVRASEPGGLRLIQGIAERLPLRAESVELVFLAWVYHHLHDRDAALAEFARVLRRDGRLVIATGTRETLDSYLWMRFFPSARLIDEERMPGREAVMAAARRAGFDAERRTTVAQPTTRGLVAYAERIGRRAISTLRLVSDREFEAGMRELRRYCAAHDRGQAVHEDVDLFVFRQSSD